MGAYKWMVLAPLLALFGETGSTDTRHDGVRTRDALRAISAVADGGTPDGRCRDGNKCC